MATNYDDIMNKHFDNAGIERENEDKSNNATNDEGNDAPEDAGAESGEGAEGQEGDQSSANEGDSSSSKPDAKSEQQPKPEAKGKDGQARDPKQGKQRVNAEADRWREQYSVEVQRRKDVDNQLKQMKDSRDTARNRLIEMERTVQSVNGAAPAEVSIGVQMVRDFKSDPVGTLRKLLTEAVAAGHTVEGIGAGIEHAAVQRMLDQRLPQPSTANTQNDDQAIQQEISQFYGQYPDARVHDETLARVLNDHPQLTLTEAMFELRSQFAARGLDWNKAINDPSNLARLNPSGGQDNKQQQQNGQRRPLPNGRQGNTPAPADHVAVAHESTSTDDIVRQAMRESGMNI